MASFVPGFIKHFWQRDPWVQPENRVTRTVEGQAAPQDPAGQAPIIGDSDDSPTAGSPDAAG